MRQRLSTQELVQVAGAAALGCYLRFTATDQLAVEHFDEGVYSSSVWYSDLNGSVYPSRHLYAPPALPVLISAASSFAGARLAPFIPGLLAGALTIVVIWAFTRAAFGMVAGLIVILLVALSDFHILYSRMALTDVPVLMWIVLAVWLGTAGIDRQSAKTMIFAGIACGCAWWTKYTGWLPLAIISGGSFWWWVTGGRRQCGFRRLILLNAVMAVCACTVWSPWLWCLQSVGGYEAVAANHRAYHTGWDSWSENLADQITWYSLTDSWLAAVAIALGVTFAGSHRWFEARCSTWNRCALPGAGITLGLLSRFIGAALVLCIATLTIGSFGVLAALGAGGITGLFLWPSTIVRKIDSTHMFAAGDSGLQRAANVEPADVRASPQLDPRLAACVVTVWCSGLLISLPTYSPFPRLLLPFLAVIWIAAAAGIGWWVEACISVARRSAASGSQPHRSVLQFVVVGLVIASLLLGMWTLDGAVVARSGIHDTRLGLRDASKKVALLCQEAAGVQDIKAASDVVPPFVIYAFGEPSVLCHLNQAGIVGRPVQDLHFPAASTIGGRRLPTFLVFGPNALRTPGFMYDWDDLEPRFEHLGDVWYDPDALVLYNLFSPQWILQHQEECAQRLEVYVVRDVKR